MHVRPATHYDTRMRVAVVAFVVIVGCKSPAPSSGSAGISAQAFEELSSIGDPDHPYRLPGRTWVHLRVLRNRSKSATNGSPPVSEVEVLEVLSGSVSESGPVWMT